MPGPREPISASYIAHLHQSARVTCPVMGCGDQFPGVDNRIRHHLGSRHSDFIHGKDIDAVVRDVKRNRTPGAQAVEPIGLSPAPAFARDPGGGGGGDISAASAVPSTAGDAGSSSYKRLRSPVTSPTQQQHRARSTSPPKRSRARPQPNVAFNDPDFLPRGPQQGKLWNPDEDPASSARPSSTTKARAAPRVSDRPDESVEVFRLLKQPETRPISQEQLVAEVKGIYAGLMMIESKCIEVDNAQSSQNDTKLNNEQWQALIALHRTLLHEHHDFFLASQHPSASPALKQLASRYAMPARMWRHGIHSFLELLRYRLPGSLEHMLTFIYLAYSMMALLFETVPAFVDTWIECLGDLGRYRMVIEDEDIRDREVWTSVSRYWYSKASDKAPTTGRLYHHLAILARPNALQQLYYYAKSLCVPIPFALAKESIMTLFDPILGAGGYQYARLIPVDVAFVKTHGILFSCKQTDNFRSVVSEFLGSLDKCINEIEKQWMEAGYYIAIANCCALLSYGKAENAIMMLIHNYHEEKQDQGITAGINALKLTKDSENALYLVTETSKIVFRRRNDANVLPHTHVILVFLSFLTRIPDALDLIEHRFPWKLLSLMLNEFLTSCEYDDRIRRDEFPREANVPPRPVPEDFALEGLIFVDEYYPSDWFSNDKIDDDEKYFEMASMVNVRKERILWLGHKLARSGRGLTYNDQTNRFGVFPQYETEGDEIPKDSEMKDISDAAGGSQADAMNVDEASTALNTRMP
ncbi:hypothetical protein F4802DRAFT_123306 [Xylaria palmicola]|nr:hypothetical protein F4802DRAFT_123306 [Xylaria palmicola]